MTQSELNKILQNAGISLSKIPQNLAEQMENYGVKTLEDSKRFLANCLNETGGFKVFEENLNYTTASRLIAVFPSAFKAKYKPNLYLKNPEKLANLVYDDRLFKKGLGNIFDGDGAKFIGRGAIQITGRNNYKNLANRTGIDFVSNPELLETDKYKFISALDFWKTHKLSTKTTLLATRQVIAGNYTENPFGFSEVLKWYGKLK